MIQCKRTTPALETASFIYTALEDIFLMLTDQISQQSKIFW